MTLPSKPAFGPARSSRAIGGIFAVLLAVLLALPALASAGPEKVHRFEKRTVMESVRSTWRPPAAVVRGKVERLTRSEHRPTQSAIRAVLRDQSGRHRIDQVDLTVALAKARIAIVRPSADAPLFLEKMPPNEEAGHHHDVADALAILQSIQYRNDLVRRLPGLQLSHVLDGRDQFAWHLHNSHLRTVEDAAALSASFDHNATVREYVTTKEVQLLRLYGGDPQGGGSTMEGRWFFCCLDRPDAKGTALPIANDMSRMATVTVPVGTRMVVGVVANQTTHGMREKGGNTQFFFPTGLPVSADAYLEYERAKASAPHAPDDLKVVLDDGSEARFRPVRESPIPRFRRLSGQPLR
jgi:hypothetical protein